ncbi:MAG: hypothetical protein ACRC9V_08725, partial [Aeromonas sp.]
KGALMSTLPEDPIKGTKGALMSTLPEDPIKGTKGALMSTLPEDPIKGTKGALMSTLHSVKMTNGTLYRLVDLASTRNISPSLVRARSI